MSAVRPCQAFGETSSLTRRVAWLVQSEWKVLSDTSSAWQPGASGHLCNLAATYSALRRHAEALPLAEAMHLVDPTAEQYEEIAAYGEGPVIAGAGTAPSRQEAAWENTKLVVERLPPPHVRARDARRAGSSSRHPYVRGEGDGHFLRGVNITSEVVSLPASGRQPEETAVIPCRRMAAMIDAVRGMNDVRPENGFLYFQAKQDPAGPRRLDQIPLPAGTPGAASVN
jgi:hypothetical protein